MKWFRSKVKFGSQLALFALAVQFVLSFGHFHDGAHAASLPRDVERPAPCHAGGALAHIYVVDRIFHADACNPVRLKTSSGVPAGQGDEDCAICAVIALASALVDATPPSLVAAPLAAVFVYVDAEAAFVDPTAGCVAFQARAPPVG
jgi:hypothetical protein